MKFPFFTKTAQLPSPQDWQLLSAYLDGQLSAREKTHLEGRLKLQPALQTALGDLSHTRTVLRSVRRRRAPHNFTLTPAMIGALPKVQPQPRLVTALRFSSALAVLLVLVSLAIEFLPGASPALQTAALPAAEAPQALAVAPQLDQASTEVPPIILWGGSSNYPGQARGMGGGIGGGPPSDTLSAKAAEAAPSGAGEVVSAPAPEAQPSATIAVPTTTLEPLTGSGPILGVRPVEEAQATNRVEEMTSVPPVPVQPVRRDFRTLQAGLILAALGAALAAWMIQRRARN
jgi:anti-sigma factor RsiW